MLGLPDPQLLDMLGPSTTAGSARPAVCWTCQALPKVMDVGYVVLDMLGPSTTGHARAQHNCWVCCAGPARLSQSGVTDW
jgi:hypothetical protein